MIDTAEKRRSVSGIPFLLLGPGVTPNASKDQEWRQQAGWGYSGILASEGIDLNYVLCVCATDYFVPGAQAEQGGCGC